MKKRVIRLFNQIRHKKQLKSLMWSYIVLMIVVMLISLVGHVLVLNITKKETSDANKRLVYQMKSICDEYIENALFSANRLINTNTVQSLSLKTDISQENFSQIVNNIISESRAITNLNKIISHSYIVYQKRNLCITNETMFDKKILYEVAFSDFFSSEKEMSENLFKSSPKEFRVLQNGKRQKLMLLYSFNSNNSLHSNGNIPVLIILELDLEKVINAQTNNFIGSFVIVCDGKKILYSKETGINYPELVKENKHEFRYNGKDYIINFTKSKMFDAEYVHMVEKTLYAKTIKTINLTIGTSFLICLLIGIVMALLLTRHSYISVSKLLDKIEIDSRKVRMKEQDMRELYLQNLITGKTEYDEASFKNYLPEFKENHYAILLFNILEFGIDESSEHKTTLFSIASVFSELNDGVSVNQYCKADGFYVCIMNFDGTPEIWNGFREKSQNTNDFLNKHLGISYVAVLSETVDDASELSMLYQKSREVLSDKYLFREENNTEGNEIDERCMKIMEYIEENYADVDLSVKKIADYFCFSFNYISKYFKEHTGEGLAKYIICKRIEKAKELLLTTKDTVNKIADKTGFYSANVFIRTFKKLENVTPGQFRKDRQK